jgi:sensor histidine kinase YesM
MELLKRPKYHIYAILSFVLYTFCTLALIKISYEIKFKDRGGDIILYYLIEAFTCGFVAYLFSNIVLYFLEKYVDFGNIKRKAVWLMIGIFLLVVGLYTYLIWPILDLVYPLFMGENIKAELFTMLANLPYFSATFIIWMFIVVAIKLYNYINQVKINQLELESNLKESQLNTLKGQINPHFMFNSLNNIRGLILEDVDRAREMITRLSEMLRYSLTKNDVNAISIKEELQTVDNYIEISKIQFEERLRFKSEVNHDVMVTNIPPMVIQMLVENAVKHGIGKIKEGGDINLKIDAIEGKLTILVENSGALTMNEDTTRLGLENIKKRLSLIYGNNAGFTLQEKEGWVVAKITIPLV